MTRIRNEVQDFSLLSSSLEVLVAEFRHYTRIKNFGTIASAVDATKQGELWKGEGAQRSNLPHMIVVLSASCWFFLFCGEKDSSHCWYR